MRMVPAFRFGAGRCTDSVKSAAARLPFRPGSRAAAPGYNGVGAAAPGPTGSSDPVSISLPDDVELNFRLFPGGR